MRGRTNANSGGIFLNATVDNYTVAPNENILAGDFVERIQYATGSLSGITRDFKEIIPSRTKTIFKMSDGNYLKVGSRTNLFHIDENGTVTRVWDEKSNYLLNSTYIFQLDSNTLIGSFSTQGQYAKATLLHYDPTDNTLETRDIVTSTYVTYGGVEKNDYWFFPTQTNNQYRFFLKSHDGSGYVYLSTGLMTITGSDYSNYNLSFSDVIRTTRLFTESDISTNGLKYVAKISNDSYVIAPTGNNKVFYSFVEGASAFSNYTSSQVLGYSTVILKKDCSDGYVDYIDTTFHRRRDFFDASLLPTIDGNTYPVETLLSDLYATNSYNIIELAENNDEHIYCVFYASKIQSFAGNYIFPLTLKADGSLVVGEKTSLGNLTSTTDNMCMSLSELENGRFLMEVVDTLYVLVFEDGVFRLQNSNIKQVRGITSQNYIKGVAKQSGSAGDTIQVYVPTVNS